MVLRQVPHDELKRLAARPDVWDRVGSPDDLDQAEISSDVIALGVEGREGAVAFVPDGAEYEVHYLLPGGRALPVIKAALRWIFENTAATAVHGLTPVDNYPALRVNQALGGILRGRTFDDNGRECFHYALTRDKWAYSTD